MKLHTHIKPISYLKSHAAQIVTELTQSREPMVITQNGAATLVVMDVKSDQEHEDTLALLKLLAIGQHDIEQGRFRDAEDVLPAWSNSTAHKNRHSGVSRAGLERLAQ